MKLSIITPVYNREDCIIRCIESVIKNLIYNIYLEHIIVDDGSTDNTYKIVKSFSRQYEHIRFIEFDRNRGTNAARNEAIKNASGDFCIILDSDDYFCDDAILIIKNTIEQNPQYKEFLFVPDDREGYFNNHPMLKEDRYEVTFKDFLLTKVTGDFVHVIDTMTMKEFPFEEFLRIYEGVFFMRFYRKSEKILYTKKIVTIRDRGRTDSVTLTALYTNKEAIRKALRARRIWIDWFKNDFINFGAIREYSDLIIYMMRLNVFLGRYKDYEKLKIEIGQYSVSPPLSLHLLKTLRLGKFYFLIFGVLLKIKYLLKLLFR